MRAGSAIDRDDALSLYLRDASRYPLLTREDEVRLAAAIVAGRAASAALDREMTSRRRERELQRIVAEADTARQAFVLSNLRLVVSIARRFYVEGSVLDLIQDGNIGLMRAVDGFDAGKGFKFSTYATWWIRQSIARGIANTGRTIRLPLHVLERLRTIRSTAIALEMELARPPSTREVAASVGISADLVRETLNLAAEALSLDHPVAADGGGALGDFVVDQAAIAPDEALSTSVLAEAVKEFLDRLEARERRVIELRYGLDRGEPRTLQEVSEHFDLTRERIRQIEHRAMAKLRHPSTAAESVARSGR